MIARGLWTLAFAVTFMSVVQKVLLGDFNPEGIIQGIAYLFLSIVYALGSLFLITGIVRWWNIMEAEASRL